MNLVLIKKATSIKDITKDTSNALRNRARSKDERLAIYDLCSVIDKSSSKIRFPRVLLIDNYAVLVSAKETLRANSRATRF